MTSPHPCHLESCVTLRIGSTNSDGEAIDMDDACAFTYRMGIGWPQNVNEACPCHGYEGPPEWTLSNPCDHSVFTKVAISKPNSSGERSVRFDTQLGFHETCAGLSLDENHTLVIKPGTTTMVHVKAIHDPGRDLHFRGLTYVVHLPTCDGHQSCNRILYITAITPVPASWHGFQEHEIVQCVIRQMIPAVPPEPKPVVPWHQMHAEKIKKRKARDE